MLYRPAVYSMQSDVFCKPTSIEGAAPHYVWGPKPLLPQAKGWRWKLSGQRLRHCCCPGQVVRLLLDTGADVDLQAQNGSAALHNAAGNGHDAAVDELIVAGCDVDVQNSGGNTAMHVAATKGGHLFLHSTLWSDLWR